jgi:hypothetical protein
VDEHGDCRSVVNDLDAELEQDTVVVKQNRQLCSQTRTRAIKYGKDGRNRKESATSDTTNLNYTILLAFLMYSNVDNRLSTRYFLC